MMLWRGGWEGGRDGERREGFEFEWLESCVCAMTGGFCGYVRFGYAWAIGKWGGSCVHNGNFG